MGRPKRLYSGQTQITFARQPFGVGEADAQPGVRQRNRWEATRNAVYPMKNGNQDPLTAYLILDCLLAMDMQVELRAKELAEWLNVHARQLVWDSITVGKHLADLRDAFEDMFGEHHGLLMGGRDYKGAFYHVNRNPETVRAAWRLLDDLQRLVNNEVVVRSRGGKTDFMGSVLLECPSLRGEWAGEAAEG